MNEQPNQPLTRGQRALAAAIKASQTTSLTEQTSDDEERKRCMIEEAISDLRTLPDITFIASMEDELELGHNLPTVIDLAYRLNYGIKVPSGHLIHASYREIGAHLPECEATAFVRSVITRLNENSIQFFLAWHVDGSTEVHLDYARMTAGKVYDDLKNLLIDDVEHLLGP